jgi:hypothetical protein
VLVVGSCLGNGCGDDRESSNQSDASTEGGDASGGRSSGGSAGSSNGGSSAGGSATGGTSGTGGSTVEAGVGAVDGGDAALDAAEPESFSGLLLALTTDYVSTELVGVDHATPTV